LNTYVAIHGKMFEPPHAGGVYETGRYGYWKDVSPSKKKIIGGGERSVRKGHLEGGKGL